MVLDINKITAEVEMEQTQTLQWYLIARQSMLQKLLDNNVHLMHDNQKAMFHQRINVFSDAQKMVNRDPPQYLQENEVLLWLEAEKEKLIPFEIKTIGVRILKEVIETIKRNRIYK